MSKGNQVAEPKMKETKIPDFDSVFEEAQAPLADAANWNNTLDSMLQSFRKLGRELRAYSNTDAPPIMGDVEMAVEGDDKVIFKVMKDGAELDNKALGAIKQYKAMCEKKTKKVHARMAALKKAEGAENARFAVDPENPLRIVLELDDAARDKYKGEPVLDDMDRSLMKLNDRISILDEQLKGPITIAETVSGLFHSLKDELKKKGAEISVAIQDNFPQISGIPDKIEDAVPDILARGWKLLTGILDYLKTLLSDIPGLVDKIKNLFETAKEFPGKLKEAASGLDMGPAEMFKTTKLIKHNVGELKNAPTILKGLTLTVQDTALQVATAAEAAVKN